jgi:hypothetical protein
MKIQPQTDNATTVISNEILRPIWYAARRIQKNSPNIVDATDGINYLTFKNIMYDDIFTLLLFQQ